MLDFGRSEVTTWYIMTVIFVMAFKALSVLHYRAFLNEQFKYKFFPTVYSSTELAHAKSLLCNFLSRIAMHLHIFFNNLITGSLFDSKHCKWGQWTFCIFFPIEIRGERDHLGQLVPSLPLHQFKRPHYCCKPVLGKRQYCTCLLVDISGECAIRNKIFTVTVTEKSIQKSPGSEEGE